MADKQLILTADDFGRSPDINDAIARFHRTGALTQASLMVNEPHAHAAAALAWGMKLRTGLHLTLCDGLDSSGHRMTRSPAIAGLRFAFLPFARAWLRREISAQFAKFTALGLPSTYWDGHAHLHLHPTVLAITIPIAAKHGFSATRLVREPGPRAIIPSIFHRLSARAIPRLDSARITYADRVFGLRKSGRMDAEEFLRALSHAGSGTTEIYFHPGAESKLPDPEWLAGEIRPWKQAPKTPPAPL